MAYQHNEDGTYDDFYDYNSRHDSMCDCAECERYWARLNARHAAR